MWPLINDLTNSIMSDELKLILITASDLNIEDRNAEIEKINVLQGLEALRKNMSFPNESVSLKDNKDAKFIIWLNNFCQEHLKRPDGTERQQLVESKKYSTEVRAALDKMWYVAEVKPSQKEYDYLILNGANQLGVEKRLDYFKGLNLDVKQTYILGSDRKLWPLAEPIAAALIAKNNGMDEESVKQIFIQIGQNMSYTDDKGFVLESVKKSEAFAKKTNEFRDTIYKDARFNKLKWPTEMDMMQEICKQRNISCEAIIAECPAGKLRADTSDTYKALGKKHNLLGKKGISISDQPHVNYQGMQLLANLPSADCETVGKALDPNTFNVPNAFDAIARTVYSGMPIFIDRIIEKEKSIILDDGVTFWEQLEMPRKQCGNGLC